MRVASTPEEMLVQIERSVRGTPLGRVTTALRKARALARDCEPRAYAVPNGGRETLQIGNLLPSHLPQRPPQLFSEEALPRSRRRRGRLRVRRLAWRLAEWQLAVFSCCALRWPADAPRAIRKKLGAYHISGPQRLAFLELVEVNVRYGRFACGPDRPEAGRGLKVSRGSLAKLEESLDAASKPLERFSAEAAFGGALAVDPAALPCPL